MNFEPSNPPDANQILAGIFTLIQQQQQIITEMRQDQRTTQNIKVQGVQMPRYHGHLDESLEAYFFQAYKYCQSQNIDMNEPQCASYVISLITVNLRGAAAAWHQYVVQQGLKIETVEQLKGLMEREFVPVDMQERLREKLDSLKQNNCKGLEDYVVKFRKVMSEVKDMSSLDRVMSFTRGLVRVTRQEVLYRRCQTTTEAIAVALEFERSHPSQFNTKYQGKSYSKPYTPAHTQYQSSLDGTPMDISNVQLSREECMKKRLCFYCKKPGHRMSECRKRAADSKKTSVQVNNTSIQDQDSDDDMVETIMINHATMNDKANELIRKVGKIGDKTITMLIDSGADHNIVRPGLGTCIFQKKGTRALRFDGSYTSTKMTSIYREDLEMEGLVYNDVILTEWELPQHQDIILGKPWLVQFNPRIDWRTHSIEIPRSVTTVDKEDFEDRLKNGCYAEIYSVSMKKQSVEPVSEAIQCLLSEYGDVFPDQLPNQLPPKRVIEHEILLKPEAKSSQRSPFRLSRVEQEALNKFVSDLVSKEWIEVSNSPWVSNIFGVPKKDPTTGKFPSRLEWIRSADPNMPIRWVIDYRHVNSQTKVAKIPLPHIEELFDKMQNAKLFSVVDLASGYHQMRMNEDSKPYTAFRTNNEIYQWKVAPMGLAGMPGTWTRLMRTLLSKLLFVVVYLDDICIFSSCIEDHLSHLRKVFEVLRENKLYARREKCTFAKSSVEFLGHVISSDGLKVDNKKIQAIMSWSTPNEHKELQRFIGLAGYYRRFIKDFAHLVLPLSKLLKKDVTWRWEEEQQKSFNALKIMLQEAPVLQLPDFNKPFIVTTDASHYCVGGVLSQQQQDSIDLPVAYYSQKLGVHEINWPVHEKELYAIKQALKKWRHYLHGTKFTIFTDNSACKWFLSHKQVSGRLARWLDFFGQYQFELKHRPGHENVVADALSRPPVVTVNALSIRDQKILLGEKVYPSCFTYLIGTPQLRIKQGKIIQNNVIDFENAAQVTTIQVDQKFKALLQDAYKADDMFKDTLSNNVTNKKFVRINGLIYMKKDNKTKRLCIANDNKLKLVILHNCHDAAVSAHPGTRRTYLLISQWYWWENLQQDVKDYVKSCESCARYKSNTTKKNGLMQPIGIPPECWHTISMDFITNLPESDGYDAIMTVVCKLSKRPAYIPTYTSATATDTANLFFLNIVRYYGLPRVIISDRDPKFTATFWQSLMKRMDIKLAMTTAHRAQADGQTERQNRTLEDSLRCLISYHGNDWNKYLPLIEYAHATLSNTSTQFSSFQIDTGRVPRNPMIDVQDENPSASRTEFVNRMLSERESIIKQAQDNLKKAQERQKLYYDKKRSNVTFEKGQLVLLSTEGLSLKHQSIQNNASSKKKFTPKWIGPFEIMDKLSENVMKLKLPKHMKIHPNFNIDKLKHYHGNPEKFYGRQIPKSAPVIFGDQGEKLYIIEELLQKRQVHRKVEYLVKWHGSPIEDSTWEPEKNINHVSHWKKLLEDLQKMQSN